MFVAVLARSGIQVSWKEAGCILTWVSKYLGMEDWENYSPYN